MSAGKTDQYKELREVFPLFHYEGYRYEFRPPAFHIDYAFRLGEKFRFRPSLVIESSLFGEKMPVPHEAIGRMVAELGMIEMLSYWKATCSPRIIIQPRFWNEEQLRWWKKLYYNGLGEFFYTNGIEPDPEGFVNFSGYPGAGAGPSAFETGGKMIIPVGGGKDSVVTLQVLRKMEGEKIPFMINPTKAMLETTRAAGYDPGRSVNVRREIDPQLLELNRRGFLNGHTPFSAVVAFTGLMAAALSGSRYLALSNESSASEPTDPATGVNHQYSKSYEFETGFRQYVAAYLTGSVEYFSFLRPLNELQIASLFSEYPHQFGRFRSCNVGSKTDTWCGQCPKCLFTWIILAPFISAGKLTDIWKKNLLNDVRLRPLLDQLTGMSPVKPFECVGSIKDVNSALSLTLNQLPDNAELPALLRYFRSLPVYDPDLTPENCMHLRDYNKMNHLPARFSEILKSVLDASLSQ